VAQLDPLLQALIDRKAQELVLADGSKPALRCGDEIHAVSQTPLSWAQITFLLSELCSSIDPARPVVHPGMSFEYALGTGIGFCCTIEDDGGKPRVRVVPMSAAPAPAAAAPAVDRSPPPPAQANQPTDVQASTRSGETAEIDTFLHQMVELGASDLHLSAGEVPRIRLHGDMAELPERPSLTADDTFRIMHEIMPEHSREGFAATRDADYSYEIPGLARFRVNAFTDRKGTGGVLRVIPAEIMTVEQLGLPPVLLRLCEIPKGLVLVTGPTGSGKSTTLATMVDHINRTRTDHIITIEDPIEFVHENRNCLVNQREIHTHTAGFKPALRAALREDPDIVLVGEMRDLETIAIAIETAETGHLVFGTLHTSTACSTVDRIIDQFPADRQAQIRTMLAESLRGVVSQILLKRVGGGRIAAMEILVVSPAISNLIREGKTFQIPSLMQTGKKQGMALLNDALLELVKKKLVEPDEAYAKAVDKTGVAAQLTAAGFRVNLPKEVAGRPSS
jgi:twitching motility protein PilT